MAIGDGKKVVIVGAGLAGSLMACYLADLGYEIHVYERRPDPRKKGYVGGRSINLALSARGIKGLAGAGLDKKVLAEAIPMRGRMVHPVSGPLAFQAYSKNRSDAINSISRGGLNLLLIEAAAKRPGVKFYFDQRCLDVGLDAPSVTFKDQRPAEEGGAGLTGRVEADLVIGADGAFSAVRARMQIQDRFEYSQSYLGHGYKELHIPARRGRSGPEFAMEPNALHIWPRGGSMMIALPNPDKSFTCTLFWPFEGPHGFGNLKTPEQVERFFKGNYPDFPALSPSFVQDYLTNPVSSLVTVRCAPWWTPGSKPRQITGGVGGTVLIGDAAHAIVPFFGQGMNCAFEDCTALAECLKRFGGDLTRALPQYGEDRTDNAEAIADMAITNFIEMRDKVASRAFRAKKKLEHALHAILPGHFVPLYNMVSFSTIPYAEARRRAQRQSQVIQAVAIWAGVVVGGLALGMLIGRLRAGG
ncbi:MAG: FAD-dependent monooxygenase [Phycisphaeraceae bacterium]|nr:FAD-dependent monooxygenase [Phycisphaeraceae bacterium]